MLSTPPVTIRPRTLLRLMRGLPAVDQETLLRFAEFLYTRRHGALPAAAITESVPSAPAMTPRPAQESVIAAIKRLRQNYAMLDTAALLNDVSLLMSAHVLQGRATPDVIDELEKLFAQHYTQWQRTHTAV